jgi:seryl-tRNA synthetase
MTYLFIFRHVAFGHCFRKEAGGTGLATRGLYRVHQFSKVELFGLTASETGEESQQLLQDMVNFQKELLEDLGLCYR